MWEGGEPAQPGALLLPEIRRPSLKVRVMVEHIHDLEIIVTDSEVEALILENHLIKEYSPAIMCA